MAGYWDDPEATAATIVDGWLHTGDLGEIDEDGYLHVVDRSKDIVISGGENVSSREVEDVLSTHPAVHQVAVVGVPDDRWGEAVCAVVVPRGEVTLDDLVAHTRGVLGGFKQPRRLVLVDELPTNAGGKVLKRELREQLAHG
jgi:fatty-acyl-CoA synthase